MGETRGQRGMGGLAEQTNKRVKPCISYHFSCLLPPPPSGWEHRPETDPLGALSLMASSSHPIHSKIPQKTLPRSKQVHSANYGPREPAWCSTTSVFFTPHPGGMFNRLHSDFLPLPTPFQHTKLLALIYSSNALVTSSDCPCD